MLKIWLKKLFFLNELWIFKLQYFLTISTKQWKIFKLIRSKVDHHSWISKYTGWNIIRYKYCKFKFQPQRRTITQCYYKNNTLNFLLCYEFKDWSIHLSIYLLSLCIQILSYIHSHTHTVHVTHKAVLIWNGRVSY